MSERKNNGIKINWLPPQPRAGALGAWDKFVGPGATGAEENIQLILGGLIAAVGLVLFWLGQGDSASLLQWIFIVVLAFDIGGGIVTNATSAAKRWYHRPGHGAQQHLMFVAAHLVHIGLVAFLFASDPVFYALTLGATLMVGALIVVFTPLYLQRPMAIGIATLIIMFGQLSQFEIAGLNWFIPALMLKLILGHALKEAPFQPEHR